MGFALGLAFNSGSEFSEASLLRAEKIKDLHMASPLFEDVKMHLLTGTPDFEVLKLESERLHERYIREMAIEFNQVKDADRYIEEYRSNKSVDAIVDKMKSEYYCPWRNQKDYEWIASLVYYTEDYMVQEYAKLQVASAECKY